MPPIRKAKAALSIRFVIVGGGMAGLACAYTLSEAGHDVLVLEQSDGKFRSDGGIRSPPNMTRLLYEWGLGPALDEKAVKADGISFLFGSTGEKVGMLKFHPQIMSGLRADFLFVEHGDIYQLLLDLAVGAGATIKFDSKVVGVDPLGLVKIDTGEEFSGDIIIGADGSHSFVREVVLGQEVQQKAGHFFSMNLTILTEEMEKDEELRTLLTNSDLSMWMGDGYAVYGYPIHGRQEYAIIMIWPSGTELVPDHWYDQHSVDEARWDFKGLEPRLVKLIKLAKRLTPTRDTVFEPYDHWVHDGGRVVLIGDAAHPLLPSGSHHNAMAIEDAAVLGNLFSRLSCIKQSPRLLTAYEELRQPRCSMVRESEYRKREFVVLPAGPEQTLRDTSLRDAASRAALVDVDQVSEVDEEYLRGEWEEYLKLFDYCARDAAEDWWTKWGGLVLRSKEFVERWTAKVEVFVTSISGSQVLVQG
ncbi:hypothetical protein JAAARDRAFT_484802 [Jaapia argillacea MUCL 33604]|uniref:FAD-binding domain-containing protein n=1 Tax=Jaapia argillacea MUCL 33604 TaxID=933084 RepID=A0A067PBP6_9AGAM|nr:hypothetical protein JAAARDRAFT_484802 [Jaapia argillacea MUCL 33604]